MQNVPHQPSALLALNKTHSKLQSELYDAYIEEIKAVKEAHELNVSVLTKEYDAATSIFTQDYRASIKPEYDEFAEIINPAVTLLKAKLQKIKERAIKATNLALSKHDKWQQGVLAKMDPLIKTRSDLYNAKCEPLHDKLLLAIEKSNDAFIADTLPQYEVYVAAAKALDDDFNSQHIAIAVDLKDAASSDKVS